MDDMGWDGMGWDGMGWDGMDDLDFMECEMEWGRESSTVEYSTVQKKYKIAEMLRYLFT